MKNECRVVETGNIDTAGNKETVLVCYCGKTACDKQQYYKIPKDFMKQSNFKINIDPKNLYPIGTCICGKCID